MGTRSLTHVVDYSWDKKTLLCSIYRHCDGYPKGHGKDLTKFLRGKKIVNGWGMNDDRNMCFNGMGDLAAKLIAYLVRDVDTSIYIFPPDIEARQEYTYIVSGKFGDAAARIEIIGELEE